MAAKPGRKAGTITLAGTLLLGPPAVLGALFWGEHEHQDYFTMKLTSACALGGVYLFFLAIDRVVGRIGA
ncbi:hypothetical protein [Acidocella sp.]|uniref:hypothetical protein n=1 Tax=Acidocella sp. TaxID=50710 RepID=UPI003D07CF05